MFIQYFRVKFNEIGLMTSEKDAVIREQEP